MNALQKVDTDIAYKPQGPILKSFHDQYAQFVRVLIGPLGSGKTQSCIFEILRQINSQVPDINGVRRSRWVIARNTQPDLFTTTIKDFREVTDPMKLGTFSLGTPPTWRGDYQHTDGNTKVEFEVIFLAFDHPDDSKKARGLQLTGVWFNEMKELARANCDLLMSRVGRFPPRAQCPDAWNGCIGDTNAPDRDHWLVKLALETKPENWWFGIQGPGVIKIGGEWVQSNKGENVQNLPKNYYKRLVAGRPEAWIRQNLANEFVFYADGRSVHPDFAESIHVQPVRPTPSIPLFVGIDFGRTPAATIIQQQHNGTIYVLDELVTENMGAKRFGEILSEFINKRYDNYSLQLYGDPAGSQHSQTDEQTPFDMLELAGLSAWPASTNDYETRTTVLDVQLRQLHEGQPAILIDPRCTTLIKGLAGAYMFKRVQVSGEDRWHDQPVKSPESHVCESLHYGLLGMGMGDQLFSQAWQQEYDSVESWSPAMRLFT